MKWPWKHSKGSSKAGAIKEKAGGKIALWLLKLQLRFAGWMDKKINPLPALRKKYLLFGFCVVLSAHSLWLVASPLLEEKKKAEIKIDVMRFPKTQPQLARPFISRGEYLHIHGFKLFLDSLAGDAHGRSIYDSIVARRPGLMDSLRMIEEYYQIQK